MVSSPEEVTSSILMDGTTDPDDVNGTIGIGDSSNTATGSTRSSTGSNSHNNNSTCSISEEDVGIQHHPGKHRIAFGSCNDPYQYNALWPIIEQHQPTAFVWCGDAIYADKSPPLQQPLQQRPSSSFTSSSSSSSSSYWNMIRQYVPFLNHRVSNHHQHQCATPDIFDIYYQQQLNVPGYQSLLSSSSSSSSSLPHNECPTTTTTTTPPHIFGTLDDHDYGCNNADRTYPYKYESGIAFLKFLNMTSSSMMYQRGLRGEGIYGVQLYDFALPKGRQQQVISDVDANIDADVERFSSSSKTNHRKYTYSNQTVAVFVLDVRTHKTPWKAHWYERFFHKDHEGDFLGRQQYQWLQRSVQQSNATIHVYVSGIQFHPYRYPDGNIAESWSQYPQAQQELYNIILSSKQPSILISGDVHMTQLLQKDCVPYHTIVQGVDTTHTVSSSSQSIRLPTRSLIEMTTSGMTHSWGTLAIPLSSVSSTTTTPRDGTPSQPPLYQHSYYDLYTSYISRWMIHLLHYTCPWTDIISVPATASSNNNNNIRNAAKIGLQYSLEQNFGEIEFDFQQEHIHLRTIGTNGQPLLQLQYTFDELSSGSSAMTDPNQHYQPSRRSHYLSMKDYQDEIRNNPQLYGNISHDDPNQWVCINHRGRDTAVQLVTGYMTSIALLTILVPLPIVVPPTLCVVLVLIVLRLLRRRSSNNNTRKNTTAIKKTIQQPQQSRILYPSRTTPTVTKRHIVFHQQPESTSHTISTFWRFTWMTPVSESTNGKKSFFPSTTRHHHHCKEY